MKKSVVVVVIVSALKGGESIQFTADHINRHLLVRTNTWCSVEHDVVASPVRQMDPGTQYRI